MDRDAPSSHILVVGITGLIGSAVAARVRAAGSRVTGLARRVPEQNLTADTMIGADISRMRSEQDWLPLLEDIDAVINCAGILQDSPQDSTAAVHADSIGALFRACQIAGVRKVVHLSAIGVDRETPTAFSRSKRRGDQILMGLDLDWVILRPSVVVGRPAYGGSALFRGLAALPVITQPPEAGLLQIVQLGDLIEAILFFLQEDAPSRITLDIAGPERLSFAQVVESYRRWLGRRQARVVTMPRWALTVMYRLGDFAGLLGWRPPIRSNAAIELKRGAVGDTALWTKTTGIAPRSLLQALAAEPASVQEKWFAQLYLLKPLVLGVFALFWLATGIVALGPGWEIGMDLMREGGVEGIGPLLIAAGAIADILIGAGIAYRRTARVALWAALCLSLTYAIIGTILVPRLWIDPLGPMLKIWPIIVFNLVAIAILDDR